MKLIAACVLAAALAAGTACSSTPSRGFSQKIVILGFDGMDPDLAERWITEGKLPAFAKLVAAGGLHRLETSPSPESLPAWASFATGVNAGKHNIYDILVRDPKTYHPRLTATLERTPFWTSANDAGLRASTVGVPVTPVAEKAWPPNDDPGDDARLVEDLEREFSDQANMILNRIQARDWDLLVGVVDSTDRVQHLMWRFIDPAHPMFDAALARAHGNAIEKMYQRADHFVADVLTHLDPNTIVMVLSVHGFHSFRWSVNLNTWLVERGYMYLHGPVPRAKTLDDLLGAGAFWENVDWPKTRAYAMGRGQIYVNLKGREGHGVVNQGREYEQLLDSLLIDLMNFLDPRTQDRVVANVYKRNEIYSGPYVGGAPDLQVALESGYRTSWQTALGGAPRHVVEANMGRWSGDHGSADYKTTAGLLITNRRPTSTIIRVIDIAPTVLKHFGVPIPADTDGKPLF